MEEQTTRRASCEDAAPTAAECDPDRERQNEQEHHVVEQKAGNRHDRAMRDDDIRSSCFVGSLRRGERLQKPRMSKLRMMLNSNN